MFSIFRDIILEAKGIDCEKAELERIARKKEKDHDKIIFSQGMKKIIVFFGVFFLVASAVQIPLYVLAGNIFFLVRGISQVILVISTFVCMKIHKKTSERIAIVLIILFILLQYSTLVVGYMKI